MLDDNVPQPWRARTTLVLTLTLVAVGLGNLQRLPYLIGEYGGGVFFLAYLASVMLLSVPILIAEIVLGSLGRGSPGLAMHWAASAANVDSRWRHLALLQAFLGLIMAAMAALMAGSGFKGAPAITAEADDASPYWDDLGTVWTIERNYIKPYPRCRWAHASLDARSGLMQQREFSADDVTSINVNTFAEAAALYRGIPSTTTQAQYSLAFALSVLLVHGRIGPDQITGAGLSDPDVADVLPRISVQEDARHSDRFPEGRWSDLTVTLKDGTSLSSGDVHARGGPEAPMQLTEIETKFRTMAAVLPEPRLSKLWAMRERLRQPDATFVELIQLVGEPVEANNV